MPVDNFNLGRSMAAASVMANTGLSLQKYADQRNSDNAIKNARSDAVDGSPDAIKALIKVSPDDANDVITSLANMDESQRKKVKAQSESTAKQMMWVMQGENEQAQSERWDQVVDFMDQSGNKEAKQYRGKFSPALAENWIMKAMTVDDINDQFAFGQLKVGMKDGKPVYLQTNPAGQTREAPVPKGVSPTDKEAYGKSGSGAGGGSLKAADENSMKSSVAALYGGTYDPQSGRISGIEKGQEKNVLAISARATRIYSDAKGDKTRTEAAAEAARELGVDVPKVQPSSIKDFLNANRANQ